MLTSVAWLQHWHREMLDTFWPISSPHLPTHWFDCIRKVCWSLPFSSRHSVRLRSLCLSSRSSSDVFPVLFVTPFVTSLVHICVLFFVQGASQGLTDLSGTNVLLTMWTDHAAAPLSCAHLGYGIGAVFVNVLCLVVALGHLLFYIRTLKNRRDPSELRQVKFNVASLFYRRRCSSRSSTVESKSQLMPMFPTLIHLPLVGVDAESFRLASFYRFSSLPTCFSSVETIKHSPSSSSPI